MTLRVNNEAGVARVAQQYVWFNRNMADVQILEAYTTTADGVRHDVQPEQIRDVQEARSFEAPMFQDTSRKSDTGSANGSARSRSSVTTWRFMNMRASSCRRIFACSMCRKRSEPRTASSISSRSTRSIHSPT